MPDPKQQDASNEPVTSESLPEKPAGEISKEELEDVSGGRITNVRGLASGLSGSGSIP